MKSRINRDEREISISELWWYVISKWKWLVVGMVVGALLMGAFGAYKAYSANNVEAPKEITMEDLTPEEQEEVKALIEDYEFYKAEVERLENNYLMNLDYNKTYRCLITYYVDTDYSYNYEEVKENYATELVAMYKTYVTSAAVFEKILELDLEGLESSDLNYMVLTSNEGNIVKFAVYANKMECEKIAETLKDAFTAYYEETSVIVGEHNLTLISIDSKEMYGENIKNAQGIWNTYIKGLADSLSARKSNLNTKQINVYDSQVAEKEDSVDKKDITTDNKFGINKKYIVVGILAGAFFAVAFIVANYVMGKTVKSIREVNQVYAVDVLGKVLRENTKNKKIAKKINKIKTIATEAEQKEYVVKTIVSKCNQLGIEGIGLCSTVYGLDKEFADLAKSVSDSGVKCKYVSNINYDSEALKEVVEFKNVVFVELLNITAKDELEAEIDTCDKLSINILGMIVFI